MSMYLEPTINFTLEKIAIKDQKEILELAEHVNEEYVIPELGAQGKQAMREARKADILQVTNKDIYTAVKAVIGNEIIGYIAWRQENYIAQLYVKSQYQGFGVGKKLVVEMQNNCGSDLIQLKASVNAIGFYTKLGFVATSRELTKNGIRYVPMVLNSEQHNT